MYLLHLFGFLSTGFFTLQQSCCSHLSITLGISLKITQKLNHFDYLSPYHQELSLQGRDFTSNYKIKIHYNGKWKPVISVATSIDNRLIM